MITREEANNLYEKDTIEMELERLEECIRKVARRQHYLSLTVSSALTEEAKAEQDKLWPNFSGLSDETVAIVREKLKFTVNVQYCQFSGDTWKIEWDKSKR